MSLDHEHETDTAHPEAEEPGDDGAFGSYGRKAVLAAAIGYAMDGFDLLVLSFALPGIIATFHVANAQAGALNTVTLLGAVAGGFIFGILGDKFGRARILTYSIVIFAIFTGLTALSANFGMLVVFRALAGVGIGGEFGVGMTLAAEAVSARARARATSWVGIGFQGGTLLAALIAAPVIGTFGWRGMFVVGIFPAIIAVILRARLKEPEAYVRRKQDIQAHKLPQRAALTYLFGNRRAVTVTVALIVLAAVQNFGYYGIMTWLPSYLQKRIGLTVTGSAVWTAVTILGFVVGIFVFGQLADRIGRRVTFWIFQVGAILSILGYSMLTNAIAILVGGFVVGIFADGMLGGIGALIAESFPTEARSTAQNVIFNIGRGIAGFAPVVIALIAGVHGFAYAIGLLAFIYVLEIIAMFFLPERKGAALE